MCVRLEGGLPGHDIHTYKYLQVYICMSFSNEVQEELMNMSMNIRVGNLNHERSAMESKSRVLI